MQILYLHQYFVDPEGWGGTRSHEFARRLIRDGHSVTIVTSTAMMSEGFRGCRRTTLHKIDGIDVVAIPVSYDNSMGALRRVVAFVQFALRSILAVFRLPRHDVVIATSTPLTVAIPAAFARVRHRCKLVFEVRDLWPEVPIEMGYLQSAPLRWAALGLERFAYAIADEIIALSPGMAHGVRRVVGRGKPIAVVPNSADLDRFAPTPGREPPSWWPELGPQARVLLYAGTLGRANDVGWIVRVLAQEDAPGDLHVVIVGEGAERAAIRDQAERSGLLGRRVHLHGPVPKDEIVGAHHAADACLSLFADIPSLATTSPNKLFDALAAGRPVLINYGGWQDELLHRSGAGARLPRDPTLAADALALIFRDPERLRSMASQSLATADDFSRDRLYADWLNVIVRAARRKS